MGKVQYDLQAISKEIADKLKCKVEGLKIKYFDSETYVYWHADCKEDKSAFEHIIIPSGWIVTSIFWREHSLGLYASIDKFNCNAKELHKIDENKRCPEFPYFGAAYPDARCIGGYLYDMDDCNESGNLIERDNGIPCPFCNTEEFVKYDPFSKLDEFIENDGSGYESCVAKAMPKVREWYLDWIEKMRERYGK